MERPVSLARGLVWCKSCGVRTALSDQGGKCPVCDPDQGNQASKNAAAELERIDRVLAGADTGASAARWTPDGSHQDPYHPLRRSWVDTDQLTRELAEYDWREAYANRHVVPRVRSNPDALPIIQGVGPVRIASLDGRYEWRNVGYAEFSSMGFDGSRDDDDAIVFGSMRPSGMTVVLMTETTAFTDTLMRVLFGIDFYEPERTALCRWEDDGGPIVPAGD